MASILATGVSPREMYDEATTLTRSPLGVSGAPLLPAQGSPEFLRRSVRAPGVLSRALVTSLTGERPDLTDLVGDLRVPASRPHGVGPHPGVPPQGLPLPPPQRQLSRPAPRAATWWRWTSTAARRSPSAGAASATSRLEGRPGLGRPPRPLPSRAHRRPRLRGRRREEDRPHQPRHPERGRPRHLRQPDRPYLNDTAGRPLRGHLEQRGVGYGAGPGDADHAPRPHAVRPGAIPADYPEVDILLIEPTRDDVRMFGYNIMRYSAASRRRPSTDTGPPWSFSAATPIATAGLFASTGSRWRIPAASPTSGPGTRTSPTSRGARRLPGPARVAPRRPPGG